MKPKSIHPPVVTFHGVEAVESPITFLESRSPGPQGLGLQGADGGQAGERGGAPVEVELVAATTKVGENFLLQLSTFVGLEER